MDMEENEVITGMVSDGELVGSNVETDNMATNETAVESEIANEVEVESETVNETVSNEQKVEDNNTEETKIDSSELVSLVETARSLVESVNGDFDKIKDKIEEIKAEYWQKAALVNGSTDGADLSSVLVKYDEWLLQNEADKATEEEASTEDFGLLTEEQLVSKAQTLVDNANGQFASIRATMDAIKAVYYAKLNRRTREVEDEIAKISEDAEVDLPKIPEDMLKPVLLKYNEGRKAEAKKIEEMLAENLKKKTELLDRLTEIAKEENDVKKSHGEFKEIQKKWKEIGRVPQQSTEEVNHRYQVLCEKFYDSLNMYYEMMRLDFKKNYEEKEGICKLAEHLSESDSNIVKSFKTLQYLHERWKEIGPVAKEQREEIWKRFSDASAKVNKMHREYFESLHAKEEANLNAKTKICEEVEGMNLEIEDSQKEWNDLAAFVINKQEEWRTIGFAPRKDNDKIYERFRAACDKFFAARNAFYKRVKDRHSANLAQKVALCEKAESLKDSTDWKETADELIELQKQWKLVGPVAKKVSDTIWKRFQTACDYFFDKKNEYFKSQKNVQTDNLAKKKDIIERIKNLKVEGNPDANAEFKALLTEWNETGHVPYKDKDAVYHEYKSAIDAVFSKLNKDNNNNRLEVFKSNIEAMATQGGKKMENERKRLQRIMDNFSQEISTIENNIGFFAKNQKSNSLIDEMRKNVEKLKQEKKLLADKIKMIDAEMAKSED